MMHRVSRRLPPLRRIIQSKDGRNQLNRVIRFSSSGNYSNNNNNSLRRRPLASSSSSRHIQKTTTTTRPRPRNHAHDTSCTKSNELNNNQNNDFQDWSKHEYRGSNAIELFRRHARFVEDHELLLPQNNNNNAAPQQQKIDARQLRSAFWYFTGAEAQAVASRLGKHQRVPIKYAGAILDHALKQQQQHQSLLFNLVSSSSHNNNDPVAGLVRLFHRILDPIRPTSFATRNYGQRKFGKRDLLNAHAALDILSDASQIHLLMRSLLQPDDEEEHHNKQNILLSTHLVHLHLWSFRCWYLSRSDFRSKIATAQTQEQQRDHNIHIALGGVCDTKGCVDEALSTMNQMEQDIIISKDNAGSTTTIIPNEAYLVFFQTLSTSGLLESASLAWRFLQERVPRERHTIVLYNEVLLTHAKLAGKHGAKMARRAQELYDHILALHNDNGNTNTKIRPQLYTATMLMTAYSNAQQPEEVQRILHHLEETSKETGIVPNRLAYNLAMNAWSKSFRPDAFRHVETIYQKMLSLHEDHQRDDILPDKITYTALIEVLVRSPRTGSHDGLDRAFAILRHMEGGGGGQPQQQQQGQTTTLQPRGNSVNSSSSGVSSSAVKPDTVLYMMFMKALLARLHKEKDPHSKLDVAKRMEWVLRRMIHQSSLHSSSVVKPNIDAYNLCLRGYAESHSHHAIPQVIKLFHELERKHHRERGQQQQSFFFRPNLDTFHSVIAALVGGTKEQQRKGSVSHTNHRNTIFDNNDINDDENNSDDYFVTIPDDDLPRSDHNRNDSEGNHIVINSKTMSGRDVIRVAKSFMDKMEHDYGIPKNIAITNNYLRLYSASLVSGAAKEAEHILQSMEKETTTVHNNNNNSNSRDYNKIIQKQQPKPNESTYVAVMDGYAKFGDAQSTERLLRQMISVSQLPGRGDCRPSAIAYTVAMDAWSRTATTRDGYTNNNNNNNIDGGTQMMENSKEKKKIVAFRNVERLFTEATEKAMVQPNAYMYTALLNALSHSGLPDAPYHAERLLHRMQDEYEKSGARNPRAAGKPTPAVFSAVLRCWANHSNSSNDTAPERTEAILTRMEDLYTQGGPEYRDLRPNISCYRAAILAWTRSGRLDAGDKSVLLLDRVDEALRNGILELHQTIHCYNMCITAILSSSNDIDMASKAHRVLERMKHVANGNKDGMPRPRDYHAVLLCCTGAAKQLWKDGFLNNNNKSSNDDHRQQQQEKEEEILRVANSIFLEYLETEKTRNTNNNDNKGPNNEGTSLSLPLGDNNIGSNAGFGFDVYFEMFKLHCVLLHHHDDDDSTIIMDDPNRVARRKLIGSMFRNSPESIRASVDIRRLLRASLSLDAYNKLIAEVDGS